MKKKENPWADSILIGLNVVMHLATLLVWIALPQYFAINLSTTGLALTLTFLLCYKKRKFINTWFRSQKGRKFIEGAVATCLIFLILALGNFLVVKFPFKVDLTKGQSNSLSPQSVEIAKSLKGEFRFFIFGQRGQVQGVWPLIELYRYHHPQISMVLIDPALRPDLVEEYGVEKVGEVVLEHLGQRVKVADHSEMGLSKALRQVSRKTKVKVLVVTGHGEREISQVGEQGLSEFAKRLRHQSFEVDEVNLLRVEKIPTEGTLLVIWGPLRPYLRPELDRLRSYLKAGGSLLVAMDPRIDGRANDKLLQLLEHFGVKFFNDLVVDTSAQVAGAKGWIPVISEYPSGHVITEGLSNHGLFPWTSSLSFTAKIKGAKAYPLAQTAAYPQSWSERNLTTIRKGRASYSEGEDGRGPLTLALAVESPTSKQERGKIVAFGTSKVLINQYRKAPGNFQLLLKSVQWLVESPLVLSSPSQGLSSEPIWVGEFKQGLIFYFSIVVGPLLFLSLAAIQYRRRAKA